MYFAPDVALAPYTTFQIGGPARWFAEAVSEEDIVHGVEFAREHHLPLFVLGGGSNLLVSDQGFPGLVLRVALRNISFVQKGDRAVFSVAAGEEWDHFVARAVAEDCAGVECLSGIPGSVGGTPVQNVGAYGQEVSQTITQVRAFDLEASQFVDLKGSECGFAYRRSILNSTSQGRYIVSRVDYELRRNGPPTIAYDDLKSYFAMRRQASPTLAEVRDAVYSIRRRKGMLILPNDRDCLSAGSFFKNPLVPATVLEKIAGRLAIGKEAIPSYPANDGLQKLSAAWLLEHAGFTRGYALGRAGISSRHTLALINRGGARAADVVALRDKITETVSSRFGIHLEPEPVWLGS